MIKFLPRTKRSGRDDAEKKDSPLIPAIAGTIAKSINYNGYGFCTGATDSDPALLSHFRMRLFAWEALLTASPMAPVDDTHAKQIDTSLWLLAHN